MMIIKQLIGDPASQFVTAESLRRRLEELGEADRKPAGDNDNNNNEYNNNNNNNNMI